MNSTYYWYLLQFKPNSHKLAERNLIRQEFETFLPLQEITKRKSSRFVNELRPLFPGYMFVSFNPDTSPWRKINSTIGVSRLVSFGDVPRPVPEELISALLARCDKSGKLLAPTQFSKGDQVRIMTGPLANFIATVESVDANRRVWLLLEFMGQASTVVTKPEQLRHTK